MPTKLLTVKRRVEKTQQYSLSWKQEILKNDFIFYIPAYRIIADSVDVLFESYKEKVTDKIITGIVEKTTKGMEAFLKDTDSVQEDSITYSYQDPKIAGISLTSTIYYKIMSLTEYSKLPKEGFIKNLPLTSVKIPEGFSNYYYTRYFMPLWSTAYKYAYSTHAKIVEPVFSNLTYTSTHIQGLLNKTPLVNKLDLSSKKPLNLPKPLTQSIKELKSKYTLSHLIDEKYVLGSNKILNFGEEFTTIYLQTTKLLPELELVISGLYNNSFTQCTVKLKSKGFIKLPLPFSKIYNIEKTSFNIMQLNSGEDILVHISNGLPLTGFVKQERSVRDVEYLKDINRLVLYNSDTSVENVFSLGDTVYENIYLDKEDNLVCSTKDGIVYTGKLDSNIAMNVPADISSNNNVFIETCNIDIVNYSVELFIKKYVFTTNTQSFCVSVLDSKGEILYLDKSLNLVPSEEKIFLKIHEIFQDKVSINIELDRDLEFVVIKIEDWDNLYSVSNVITQPILKPIPSIQLPIDSEETLRLVNDKITYISLRDDTSSMSVLE